MTLIERIFRKRPRLFAEMYDSFKPEWLAAFLSERIVEYNSQAMMVLRQIRCTDPPALAEILELMSITPETRQQVCIELGFAPSAQPPIQYSFRALEGRRPHTD